MDSSHIIPLGTKSFFHYIACLHSLHLVSFAITTSLAYRLQVSFRSRYLASFSACIYNLPSSFRYLEMHPLNLSMRITVTMLCCACERFHAWVLICVSTSTPPARIQRHCCAFCDRRWYGLDGMFSIIEIFLILVLVMMIRWVCIVVPGVRT